MEYNDIKNYSPKNFPSPAVIKIPKRIFTTCFVDFLLDPIWIQKISKNVTSDLTGTEQL